jgi:hypothetical protein
VGLREAKVRVLRYGDRKMGSLPLRTSPTFFERLFQLSWRSSSTKEDFDEILRILREREEWSFERQR